MLNSFRLVRRWQSLRIAMPDRHRRFAKVFLIDLNDFTVVVVFELRFVSFVALTYSKKNRIFTHGNA